MADPTRALPVTQAHFAVSGKAPFENVESTGRSINQITGEQILANAGLGKLFDNKENAQATADYARAGVSSAQREYTLQKIERGTDGKPLTPKQLRDNEDILFARNEVANIPPDVMKQIQKFPIQNLPADQQQLLKMITLSKKRMYGEKAEAGSAPAAPVQAAQKDTKDKSGITQAEIAHTAKKHGITEAEVRRRLGI